MRKMMMSCLVVLGLMMTLSMPLPAFSAIPRSMMRCVHYTMLGSTLNMLPTTSAGTVLRPSARSTRRTVSHHYLLRQEPNGVALYKGFCCPRRRALGWRELQ